MILPSSFYKVVFTEISHSDPLSRYVLECAECGVIYRSRQYWFGNEDPVRTVVRTELRHAWPGVSFLVFMCNEPMFFFFFENSRKTVTLKKQTLSADKYLFILLNEISIFEFNILTVFRDKMRTKLIYK